MRNRIALASAAIVAGGLALPHMMPRYISSHAFVFRVSPLSGAVCVARIQAASPYELLADGLGEELCPATRAAALATARAELLRREQERSQASGDPLPAPLE